MLYHRHLCWRRCADPWHSVAHTGLIVKAPHTIETMLFVTASAVDSTFQPVSLASHQREVRWTYGYQLILPLTPTYVCCVASKARFISNTLRYLLCSCHATGVFFEFETALRQILVGHHTDRTQHSRSSGAVVAAAASTSFEFYPAGNAKPNTREAYSRIGLCFTFKKTSPCLCCWYKNLDIHYM